MSERKVDADVALINLLLEVCIAQFQPGEAKMPHPALMSVIKPALELKWSLLQF